MIYNFSSGPAMLPREVMEQVHAEWFSWQGTGLSAVEWSHRAAKFEPMIHETKALIAELLEVPNHYKVIFLQGGASLMWSIIPMNVAWGKKIGQVRTGVWSDKAYEEAKKYSQVTVVANAANANGSYTDIAADTAWQINPDLEYVHYCSNETIQGIQYHETPKCPIPLVCDTSSDILSRPMAVEKYGAIYAGAQKNMGVAGLTVLIIREDWLDRVHENTALIPTTLHFKAVDDHHSLLNTPSTFAIYTCNLVLKWMKKKGEANPQQSTLASFAQWNADKANALYDYLDSSDFYTTTIAKRARSQMSVTFSTRDPGKLTDWLAGAEKAGLYQLKGHRLQGGLRASLYNAMPKSGVEALLNYMNDFARQ